MVFIILKCIFFFRGIWHSRSHYIWGIRRRTWFHARLGTQLLVLVFWIGICGCCLWLCCWSALHCRSQNHAEKRNSPRKVVSHGATRLNKKTFVIVIQNEYFFGFRFGLLKDSTWSHWWWGCCMHMEFILTICWLRSSVIQDVRLGRSGWSLYTYWVWKKSDKSISSNWSKLAGWHNAGDKVKMELAWLMP